MRATATKEVMMKPYTLFALASLSLAVTAPAAVVFTESFESPDVGTYSNSPAHPNWVNANQGFNASRQGIWDESHTPYAGGNSGPTGATYSTPFGEQAYGGWYTNSGITSREGTLGDVRAETKYILTLNVASPENDVANWRVQVVAFDPGVDDSGRNDVRNFNGMTLLSQLNGTATLNDFSESVYMEINIGVGEVFEGRDIGIRLLGDNTNIMYDNIAFDDQGFRSYAPEPGTAGLVALGMLMLRGFRKEETPTYS